MTSVGHPILAHRNSRTARHISAWRWLWRYLFWTGVYRNPVDDADRMPLLAITRGKPFTCTDCNDTAMAVSGRSQGALRSQGRAGGALSAWRQHAACPGQAALSRLAGLGEMPRSHSASVGAPIRNRLCSTGRGERHCRWRLLKPGPGELPQSRAVNSGRDG